MLKSLTLRNFQKHKALKIEFHPNVTTIIGRNDAGKSAVVRALRLVCLNQPAGIAYIRRGAKTATVDLSVDGHSIRRLRSKRRNNYNLRKGDSSWPDRPFNAFGKGKVPDPVAKVLNIGEINFQAQLDPPFWFLESAGQVSKNLNAIINLSSIDKTLENIAKRLRKAKSEVEVGKTRLEEAETALAELKWTEQMEDALAAIERAKKRNVSLSIKRARLEGIVKGIRESRKRKIMALRATREGRAVIKVGELWEKRLEEVGRLRVLVKKLRRARLLTRYPVPDLKEVIAARVDADKSAEDRRALEYIVEQIREARKWREAKEKELSKSAGLLLKLTKHRCPTCGQRLRAGHSHQSLPLASRTSTFKRQRRLHGRKKKTGTKSNDVPW